MSKGTERKEKLFKIYSDNLKWISEKSSLKKIIKDFDYGCLCPICLNYFDKKDNSLLTFDHNPQQSLGGKDGVLTCETCNNEAGHKIDNQLLIALNEIDINCFKPNTKFRKKIQNESTKNETVSADFTIGLNKELTINLIKKNSNPVAFDNFINSESISYTNPIFINNEPLSGGWHKEYKFTFEKENKTDERLASIGLLKIAYLIGFQKLGHTFLFNKNLENIRKQIKSPKENFMNHPFWIHFDFPDEYLGLNMIMKPKELRCFLVIFDLKTDADKYRFAIALPGYNDGDEQIYENINHLLCKGDGSCNVELNNYINHVYDIKDEEKVFIPAKLWDELNKIYNSNSPKFS